MISVSFTCKWTKLSFRNCVCNCSNSWLSAVCRVRQWWWWELWTYCVSKDASKDADGDVSGDCGRVSERRDTKERCLIWKWSSRGQKSYGERGKCPWWDKILGIWWPWISLLHFITFLTRWRRRRPSGILIYSKQNTFPILLKNILYNSMTDHLRLHGDTRNDIENLEKNIVSKFVILNTTKGRGMSWIAERLSAFQRSPCFIVLTTSVGWYGIFIGLYY